MSNKALTWARTLDSYWNCLPKSVDQVKAAVLLYVLCDAANDDQLVWLAAETISTRTRIRSRNTIAKYLGHLQDLALIEDTGERRRGSSDRGGAKTYRILIGGGDCSVQSEQSPDVEIAQSRVSNHGPGGGVEIAQSEGEIAQFRGGDCSLQSEHEALKPVREAAERAGAREAAAAVSPIPVTEFDPPDDLVEQICGERPDLAGHFGTVVDRFAAHPWRRRRTPAEWAVELRTWCEREHVQEASPAARATTDWIGPRIRTLLSLPPDALEAQLAADPPMRAVFELAGGPDGVAGSATCDLAAWYRAAAAQRAPPRARHGPRARTLHLVETRDTGGNSA